VFSYSSFADNFLIIAADREFIPTTPEAVRIFSEVFASVDDSLPPLLAPKDRPWWHVEFPLSPMADPWIPDEEAMAISVGVRPCVVQVDCVECATTGEGKATCSSTQPDPAVATWKCLLCPKRCEWASQLHNHVKEWHLFLHNYFLEGRMPSFENCIYCRKFRILVPSSYDFLSIIIPKFSDLLSFDRQEARDCVGPDGSHSAFPPELGSVYGEESARARVQQVRPVELAWGPG
jgi:hypothetical protein